MLRFSAVLSLVLLSGCAASYPADRNHVSDLGTETKVQGVTYDHGPVRPTFWERIFARLGIK